MSLAKPIARNLDEPTRIMGLSPMELGCCATFYSILNPVLKGIPFAPLIALIIASVVGMTLITFNRNFPPYHGFNLILHWLRPGVVSVMPFTTEDI